MQNTAVRWVLIFLLALVIVGLLAKARGDDSETGRDPRNDSLPSLVVQAS